MDKFIQHVNDAIDYLNTVKDEYGQDDWEGCVLFESLLNAQACIELAVKAYETD